MQTKEIEKSGSDIADFLGKIHGYSADIGELVQKTATDARTTAYKRLGKAPTPAQIADFNRTFNKGLVEQLLRTNKKRQFTMVTDAVVGYVRKGDMEGTKALVDQLFKQDPKALEALRGKMFEDIMKEAVSGSKDAVIKGNRFSGKAFVDKLNEIGDERLGVIFGTQGSKEIKNFAKLTGRVNGDMSAMVGRFWNAGVLSGMFGTKGLMRRFGIAGTFNVMGRVMLNPQGAKAYEAVINASAANSIKALHAANTVLSTHIEHEARDYILMRHQMDQNAIEEQQKEQGGNK